MTEQDTKSIETTTLKYTDKGNDVFWLIAIMRDLTERFQRYASLCLMVLTTTSKQTNKQTNKQTHV
jgi:hypothetical protein